MCSIIIIHTVTDRIGYHREVGYITMIRALKRNVRDTCAYLIVCIIILYIRLLIMFLEKEDRDAEA